SSPGTAGPRPPPTPCAGAGTPMRDPGSDPAPVSHPQTPHFPPHAAPPTRGQAMTSNAAAVQPAAPPTPPVATPTPTSAPAEGGRLRLSQLIGYASGDAA